MNDKCFETLDMGCFVAGEKKAAKLIMSRDDCSECGGNAPVGAYRPAHIRFLHLGTLCRGFHRHWRVLVVHFRLRQSRSPWSCLCLVTSRRWKENEKLFTAQAQLKSAKALNVEVWMWLRRTVVD